MPNSPRKPSKGRRAGGRRPAPKRRDVQTKDRARSCAMNLLAFQAARFPDLAIEEIDVTGLDARDAGLARAIDGITMRRWGTLRHLIGEGLNRPFYEMQPHVASALLAGGAQIVFMDRVPAHAAVDESVRWGRLAGGRGAGGLVNAVLRRLTELVLHDGERVTRETWNDQLDEIPLEDGRALVLTRPVLPEDDLERLSVATNCPSGLLDAWSRDMPLAEVRRLALHGIVQPPTILNTAHADADLPDDCTPHAVPGHHLWTGSHTDLAALLAARRDIWVQDPGSSLGVGSVTDLSPGVVIDMCAGLGTKTRQLRAAFPEAKIIATDVDVPRFKTLQRVFANDKAVNVIHFNSLLDHAGKADLVLLDVPCSNSGVLARRPEARYRYSPKRTAELAGMQKQIIADAIPLLRDEGGQRGRILYSTCSLDRRENEDQAAWAAQWHNFELSRERRRIPEGGPGEPRERYSDGAFAMLLSR